MLAGELVAWLAGFWPDSQADCRSELCLIELFFNSEYEEVEMFPR